MTEEQRSLLSQIEIPGGDPLRSISPLYKGITGPQKSHWWFAFYKHKRGIALDSEKADGLESSIESHNDRRKLSGK